MRIGVISDTHIPDRAEVIPQQIIDDFKNVDMIIHAGDFADVATLNQLKNLCPKLVGVAGNMDAAQIKDKLPEKYILKIGKFKIGITHGIGHPDGLVDLLGRIFKNDSVDAILFGHSHKPFNEKIKGVLSCTR